MPNKQTLGAIVPFYNEENFLEESVLRLIEVKIINQIILVDDCSNDKSFDIANDLSKRFNHIEVVKNGKNTGKGGAVKYGLNSIETEYVFIHDADLEYFPSVLHLLEQYFTSFHTFSHFFLQIKGLLQTIQILLGKCSFFTPLILSLYG